MDGHGEYGHEVSSFLKQHLHLNISKEIATLLLNEEEIEGCKMPKLLKQALI